MRNTPRNFKDKTFAINLVVANPLHLPKKIIVGVVLDSQGMILQATCAKGTYLYIPINMF